jgi:hypothetical protein
MLKKIIALGAVMALAGPGQAATITGTFSAALTDVASSTFGIGAGSTFTNQGGFVTSATDEFSGITSGTAISLSSVTATFGSAISFMSSFGNFMGTITNVASVPAPNARVGLNVLGNFTPSGSLGGFTAGPASMTLSFTQTGDLLPGSPQPAVSGSFTFASPPSGVGIPSGVPEPASWAMLIGGFGLTGAAMRRRKAMTAVTA